MAPKSLAEQFADLDDPTPKGVYFLFTWERLLRCVQCA